MIIATAFLFLSGCSFFKAETNEYIVSVKYIGNEKNKNLRNISVIAGSDKFWWASMQDNESKTVALSTKKNPDTNVTLLFSLDDRERTWESGNFPENADYKIDLSINAEGNVESKICRIPC